MTTKEKTVDIFYKYYQATKDHNIAKECALIAINDILEATKMHQYALNEIPSKIVYNHYWSEVKKEIEKL